MALLLFAFFCQFLLDNSRKLFKRSYLQPFSIDKDRWGPSNARIVSVLNILIDPCLKLGIIDIFLKLLDVEVQTLGELDKFCVVKGAVIVKQLVVILPEFSLSFGGQGRHCGLCGKPMVSKREVFKSQFHIVCVFFEHLLE